MVRGGLRQWRLFEGLYGDRLLFQLGVAMAGEGLAMANPATIPNRHNMPDLYFHVDDGCHSTVAPVLGPSRVP